VKTRLYLVGGDAKASIFNLSLPIVIGRGRGATLVLPHPLVSRRHCELYEDSGKLMVRDLGSLNGTYVGNQRVQDALELPNGELLTVATVNFRAAYGDIEDDTTTFSDNPCNSDSTHDSVRLTPSQAAKADASGDPPPAPSAKPKAPFKDRDTEWQVGNSPPRSQSDSGNDLNSLLNNS
jgi:pSer/pThr/pTyr-binding forkhead associated (FHA) protein